MIVEFGVKLCTVLLLALKSVRGVRITLNNCDFCNISTVSASATYDIGTNIYGPSPATSDSPIDVFNGETVIFKGTTAGGSNTVFNFEINCTQSINITGLTFDTAAHGSDTIYFENFNGETLWSYVLGAGVGNSLLESNIDGITDVVGNLFYFIETNTDSTWRWRQNLTLYATVDTNTPTNAPTMIPTSKPSYEPTQLPSANPTNQPSKEPSSIPSSIPSSVPSTNPSSMPSWPSSSNNSSESMSSESGLSEVSIVIIVLFCTSLLFLCFMLMMHYVRQYHQKKLDISKEIEMGKLAALSTRVAPIDKTQVNTNTIWNGQSENENNKSNNESDINIVFEKIDNPGSSNVVNKVNKENKENKELWMEDSASKDEGNTGGVTNDSASALSGVNNEATYERWSQKEVLQWIKQQFEYNGIDNERIELFLNEFNDKYITGKMLKQLKKNEKLMQSFKSQFTKENQVFGIWMVFECIVDNVEN